MSLDYAAVLLLCVFAGLGAGALWAWLDLESPWRLEDDGPDEIVRIGRGGMGDE